MNEEQLSKFYYLKKEIKDIEERIEMFGYGVGSSKLVSVKCSSTENKAIQEKYQELKDLYMETRISALEEYIKIEKYISSIDDPEIRSIMRGRFLDLKTWEQLGEEFNSDRTTVSKKIRRFIKLSHNSHSKVV